MSQTKSTTKLSRRSGDSRQRLIDATIDSIVEIGYARTTVGQIVSRAGMTKGAHVYHFDSKMALIKLTVEQLFERMRSRLAGIRSDPAQTVDGLEASLQTIAEAILDKEGVALLEVWMASRTDAELRALFREAELANEQRRLEELTGMYGEAVVRNTDAHRLLEGAMLIIRGLVMQDIVHGHASQSPLWKYWRRHIAEAMYACIRDAS